MIAWFKALLEALQSLNHGLFRVCGMLEEVSQRIPTDDALQERVEALERSRATWEAEVEGQLMKAESKFKVARASEERARGMMKRAEEAEEAGEGDEEILEEVPDWYIDLVREGHAGGGEAGGVQPVREDVEGNSGRPAAGKDQAKALKWGY